MTIKQQIVSAAAAIVGGASGDIASQLSGMIAQASGLANAGVGLPGLNAMGSQISSLASTITSGPGATSASQIASLGTMMATAPMSSMASLTSQMTSLASQLTSQLNPGGLLAQVLHTHILDKLKGVVASAFQGLHTTTWDNNGVTHTSPAAVTLTAPQLPHNGNILGSDNLTLTKALTAAAVGTSSDERLKTNIQAFPPVLDRVMAAEVKTFDKHFIATDVVDGAAVHSVHDEYFPSFGFIAQALRKIFPELVTGDEATGFLSVDEGKVGIVALAALQEFVEETRREISDLKRRLGDKG
jgi:hypothetical protein